MSRLLVVEDDHASSDAIVHAALARDGTLRCECVDWDSLVPERVHEAGVKLVVAVVKRDRTDNEDLLESLFQHTNTPIFAVLPPEPDDGVVRLVLRHAEDFALCPLRPLELRHRLRRLIAAPADEDEGVRHRLVEEMALGRLVGEDPAFLRAMASIRRFGRSEASVLITGETGTGKELCARAIHQLSRRRGGPFIAVDCGAVPDQLFENELFGHTRGAFTDAHRDQKGLVSLAEGGTLFLDEVDALSLAAQAKLLRFLQERSFRALGSDRFDRANVKIVAATNRTLEACVDEKLLRSDLYFRLNVLRLHLPPLRERAGDIPLLAASMLREDAAESCAPNALPGNHGNVKQGNSMPVTPTTISPAALRLLAAHRWPGNIRELWNVVQRAINACDGHQILPAHITIEPDRAATAAVVDQPAVGWPAERPDERRHEQLAERLAERSDDRLGERPHPVPPIPHEFRTARAAALAEFERHYAEALLRKHGGNVTHAAREAQQDRRAFGRILKKYQINRRAL